MNVILRLALALALASFALAAQAAIGPPVVTFSQITAVTTLPGSGSVVVDFGGTVTGYTGSTLTNWSGTTLSLLGGTAFVVPTSTYIPAIQAAISATGSYTGKLLSYTFASSAATGLYGTLAAPVTLGCSNSTPGASNPTSLSVLVGPSPVSSVPGPGALAAFGLGMVGRMRRKRA